MNNRSELPSNNNTDQDEFQIVLDGYLRHARVSDVVEFSIYFLKFEMRFTVTIPENGTYKAPVYVKCKLCAKRPL